MAKKTTRGQKNDVKQSTRKVSAGQRASRSEREPLHQVVYNHVLRLIQSGGFDQGQKLPTEHQLMRQFGVSRATVGKAMRALEIQGLIRRQPGVGSFVCKAAVPESLLFAVLVPGLGDMEFFEPICASIARQCSKQNYGLLWENLSMLSPYQMTEQVCRRFVQRLVSQKVAGVFVAPDEIPDDCPVDTNKMLVEAIAEAGIQIVLFDRDYLPYPQSGPFDVVGIDNFQAGYAQTKHLIENGCRHLVYITRPGNVGTKSARIGGFHYALREAGLPHGSNLIFKGNVTDARFVDKILAKNPDGIVCFHDPIAAALVQELLAREIAVPEEIQVIGIDDVKYSRLIQVPLTTIRQPCDEIGQQALDVMVERVKHTHMPPMHIYLGTELVVRESTMVWES